MEKPDRVDGSVRRRQAHAAQVTLVGGVPEMNATRRDLLVFVGASALSASTRAVQAQPYPTRPIHWIVPFPAGGPSDILARLIGQFLGERLGRPFVIENRVGASGNIGTQAVASAPPDG